MKYFKQLLPFTFENIVRYHFRKKSKTILDLGCGNGSLGRYIEKGNGYKIVGVDSFRPFLSEAKKTGSYQQLILKDVRKVTFPKKSFDIVICSQVIMYLSKFEATTLLERIEKIARHQIIVTVPQGDIRHKNAQDNPHQTSKSSWSYKDLRKRNYTVYGQGFKYIYKENGYNPQKTSVMKKILFAVSYLLSPFVYLYPQYATHLICVKNMKS